MIETCYEISKFRFKQGEDMRFELITEGDPHQRVSVCEKRHIELKF